MAYTHEDLSDIYQVHQGNQPDGSVANSSYMVEVDKFLAGKENHLTHHGKYMIGADLIDKSFPTPDQARDVMEK